jgi:hypothetical protein
MSEALFDIVFKGKHSNKIDQSKAILHFSKLFKLPVEKAGIFFDGKARTLKKSLNLEKASQFRAALKKAGLRVSMLKLQGQKDELTLAKVGVVLVSQPFVQPREFETSHFTLDEVGIEIVEFTPIAEPQFDTSNLKIDEVGVQIVAKPVAIDLDIDVTDLTLDEVGAIMAEEKPVAEPELDISELHIDEVGVILVEETKVPEPVINIDKLKLVDD